MDEVGVAEVSRIQEELAVLHARQAWTEMIPRAERLLAIFLADSAAGAMDVAGCYFNLGWMHKRIRDWDRAETLYRQALRQLETAAATDQTDLVPALDGLAGFLRERGRYGEAAAEYSRLLSILERDNQRDTPQTAACLNELAMTLRLQGRHNEAIPLYRRALGILEIALGPGAQDVGSLHGNLALAYLDGGQFSQVEDHLNRMQTIFDATLKPNDSAFARLASHRALLHSALGEPDRAEAFDREAMKIRETALDADDPLLADSMTALGADRLALGWLDDAQEMLRKALAFRERILGEDHPDTSETLNNLGAALTAQARYDEAEATFRRALDARTRTLGALHPKTLTSLNNLASTLEALQRYNEAASLYDAAIAQPWAPHDPRLGSLLNNRALLSSAMGLPDEAERLYERALSIKQATLRPDDRRIADTLANLGILRWAAGKPHEACEPLERANRIYENLIRLLMNAGAERQKRVSLEASQAHLSAIVTLHLHVLPDSRQARDLALDLVLQRKGRLLDGLARPIDVLSRTTDANAAALLRQWKAARTQRAALATAYTDGVDDPRAHDVVDALERQEEQLEATMGDLSRALAQERTDVTAASACRTLQEDAALLEFIRFVPFVPAIARGASRWTAPRYGAYLLTRDGFRAAADLGDAETIDTLVSAFRDALGRASADHEEPARELYRTLLVPLGFEPRDFRHIAISPDGLLNGLPFAALLTPEDRYLVDVVSISYLYSGRDLLRTTATPEDGSVVVLASPDFGPSDAGDDGDDYKPLDGALREAELIRDLIPSAELLLRGEASKAALMERSRPLLLHIATHGEYHEPGPRVPLDAGALRWVGNDMPDSQPQEENSLLRSWLALSGANLRSRRADGILTALEVTALDLHGTALVTLSACDTAVGAVRPGDGIYGLARAFQLAGARSLLATLWNVDDDSTCELVRRAYTQLCVGAPRVNALCNVQRELMRTVPYRHPFYWSGFVLIGDFEAISALARHTVRAP